MIESLIYPVWTRLQIVPLPQVSRAMGHRPVYRISVYFLDQHAHHSVATFLGGPRFAMHTLEIRYDGLFEHRPLTYDIPWEGGNRFMHGMQEMRFDRLPNQTIVPHDTATVWFLEHASGTWYRRLHFAVPNNQDAYASLIETICTELPQAVRQINRTQRAET